MSHACTPEALRFRVNPFHQAVFPSGNGRRFVSTHVHRKDSRGDVSGDFLRVQTFVSQLEKWGGFLTAQAAPVKGYTFKLVLVNPV